VKSLKTGLSAVPGGEEARNDSCSRFALIAGGDARGPTNSLEWFRVGTEAADLCGRDARGPTNSLEWRRVGTEAADLCGRDARGPTNSLEWRRVGTGVVDRLRAGRPRSQQFT
jgi:hypothetical protein